MCSELLCLGQLHVATVGTKLLNFKRFRRILCTVVCGMFNCRAARLVDLCGLRTNAAQTVST
jgi:hypothetical protein